MAIAIIEIITPPGPGRSGHKKDTGETWGPFYEQQIFVHGETGPYPKSVTITWNKLDEVPPPGLYVVDASALYTDRSNRLAVSFTRMGRLVPLVEASKQIEAFLAQRNSATGKAA